MINQNPTEPQARPGYEEALAQARAELQGALTGSPLAVRGFLTHLAQASGKLVRARSLLTCAQGMDDTIHPDAVKAAVSVELAHMATLVHDDLIDNADTRRGIPTLHKAFGAKNAVLCGDWLLCLALRKAAEVPDRGPYTQLMTPDYMSRICLGELLEWQNNRNYGLSVRAYLRIISGKTAALFEAAFYTGAVICPEAGDERERRRYRRLGHCIGMIFQLTDDCIDYEAEASLAKKPVRSDFEQGTVTLPLIAAMQSGALSVAEAAAGSLSREEAGRVVREAGGLRFTRAISRRYYDKAENLIASLRASAEKKARLRELLGKAYGGLTV